MKYAATALFAGLAAATANVTVSNFAYVGVNGYPQLQFNINVDGIQCFADHFVIGDTYNCTTPAWQFTVLGYQGNNFTLHHTVDW